VRDDVTGKDDDHRRELIREHLELLAGGMGVEVFGYSVMSNLFHSILRRRPDVVTKEANKGEARSTADRLAKMPVWTAVA